MLKELVVLCVCCVWLGAVGVDGNKGDKHTSLKSISQSNHNFTSALYRKLSRAEGNVFFSPLSIQMILALASMGARGPTAVQMKRGLSLTSDDELTKDGFQKLTNSLKRSDDVVLKIANKVFTDSEFELKPEFMRTAQTYFNADASTVDFKQDVVGATQKINRWVEVQTENKIKELFAEGALDEDTQMVLANAVYFKANWATQFNESLTQTKPFHVSPTETKDVPMMHITGEFFYKKCKELDAQVIELPYVDYKLSLVVILPNKRDGIAELERRMAEFPISLVTKHLRLPEVIVWMPKFKMEQTFELNDVLKEMGMTYMFSNSANFSGITENGVHVDKVAHKAFIEVNEEGSEAAAATGMGIVPMSMPDPPVHFTADHPFIFMIRNKLGGSAHAHGGPGPILFMGRYQAPSGTN